MGAVRSALVVASDTYDDPALRQLRAPTADAQALAEVLSNPEIADFEVTTLLNEPAHVVNAAVEEFLTSRSPEDLLLLHFSCHGIKDQQGELYFAMPNTKLRLLGATGVAANFVNGRMSQSRSRRIVLFLDCCYAGAFERGMRPRASAMLDLEERFSGRGRAVITASGALEYAFEGGQLSETSDPTPSVFTSAMVRGLSTGEADRDQDGYVDLDELYDYINDAVQEVAPQQNPGKWTYGLQGRLVIARRGRPVTTPSSLPDELREAIESSLPSVRAVAVQELGRLLTGTHAGLSLAARIALQQLADDDSRTVAIAAADALEASPVGTPGGTTVPAALPAVPQPPVPPPGRPFTSAAEPTHPAEKAQHVDEGKLVKDAQASVTPTGTKPTSRLKRHESGSQQQAHAELPEQTTVDASLPRTLEPRKHGRAGHRVSIPGGAQLPAWAAAAAVAVVVLAIITTATVYWLQGGDGPASAPADGPPSQLPTNKMIVVQKDPNDPIERSDLMIKTANSTAQQNNILLKDGMRPTLAPDRRHVLFTRKPTPDSEYSVLWIADANDGGNPHRFVTDNNGDCRYVQGRPAWNHSGKLVAMSCMETPHSAFPKIYIFHANGVLKNTIEVGGTLTGFMTWTRMDGQDGIVYVKEYEGSMKGRVATENPWVSLWWQKSIQDSGRPIEISKHWKLGSYDLPDWSSPDELLFQRKDDPDKEWGHLCIWDMNMRNKPKEWGGNFQGAAWSPNGEELVFYWMKIKPAHQYTQNLSVARRGDLDQKNRWTNVGSEQSSGEAPAGKAQPAWGTL
jgi:hypothetical protein